MPIDFQLTGVEIQSFRGLHSINIDFPQDCLNVLIGANNSGKSTILDAIALALEGPSSYNYTPEKYDYHHFPVGGCAKEFRIALRFDAEDETRLPAVRGGFGDPIPVHGVCVTGSIEKKRYVHKTR